VSVKGFLDDFYEKKRHEFYSHVRPWIAIGAEMAKATGWRMSHDQYTALIDFLGGMNSYERKVPGRTQCASNDFCPTRRA